MKALGVIAVAGTIVLLLVAWRSDSIERAETPRQDEVAAAPADADAGTGSPRDAVEGTAAEGAAPVLFGSVTGPEGALWGVRVVALVEGVELASVHSRHQGSYRLTLPAGTERADLHALPDDATGLDAVERTDVPIAPGEQRIDFALQGGPAIAGLVVDAEGRPIRGVRLVARRSSDGERESVAISDATGRFALRRLRSSLFEIVTGDGRWNWLVDPPVRTSAGANGVRIVVRPAFRLRAYVQCVEIDGGVPGARVRGPGFELPLEAGVCDVVRPRPALFRSVELEFSAEGYETARHAFFPTDTGTVDAKVVLVRRGPSNLRFDLQPASRGGELRGTFHPPRGIGWLHLRDLGGGRFEARVPLGVRARVWVGHGLPTIEFPEPPWHGAIALPPSGRVVVVRDQPTTVILYGPRFAARFEGARVRFELSSGRRSVGLPRGKRVELAALPAGEWIAGARGKRYEFTVVAGGETVIRLPAR